MTDVSILTRQLDVVNDNVRSVAQLVDHVDTRVQHLAREQELAKDQLDQFYREFQEFVVADARQKERQFATTRIIEVRQEIEKKFGHYDELRRHTTGILQATDIALVSDETLKSTTEEMMLNSPRYWLAPALVALSAWIRDDKTLADKALVEVVRRDEPKAALFFSLLCRRAARHEACVRWLERYFLLQDPRQLRREVVVMLDAMINGIFGPAALGRCSGILDEWIADLEEEPQFIDLQREHWAEVLRVRAPQPDPDEYPLLREHCAEWPALETALCGARRNAVLRDYFTGIFEEEISTPPTLEIAVDDLLTSLVSNFDTEELPLRQEELRLKLIVEAFGDTQTADQRFNTEIDALALHKSFAALLTSAAMHEESDATPATRRYAVARSKEWILAGYQDLLARERGAVPSEVQINIGTWSGLSVDGSNEEALSAELMAHYAQRIRAAVEAVGITLLTWALSVGGGVLGAWMIIGGDGPVKIFGLFVLMAALGYFFFRYRDLDNVRTRVRQNLERERDSAANILKATLAELADFRRDLTREDAIAPQVEDILENVQPGNLVLGGAAPIRSVIS